MSNNFRFIFRSLIPLAIILVISQTAAQTRIQSTDAETRLEWFRQHQALQEKTPFKNMTWRHIGPEIMSGRIVDVAIPPGSKHTIYAASASGGVWKTENEGTSWTPLTDNLPSGSVGDVTVSLSDPSIVWIGLGEANIFRSSMSGCGVYKSLDAGKTWQHMGLADTNTIARIIIHPENPDIVYVAASGHEYTYNPERGVYKTTDGGKTWKKILYIDEKTGAIDLVMDPSDSRLLYASVWNRIRRPWHDPKIEEGNGIYKTTDGGENWKHLTNGLPPSGKAGRIGIDVCAGNPNVVYAFVDAHYLGRARSGSPEEGDLEIKPAEFYRSDDKGETWRKVSRDSQLLQFLVRTYGWVFGQMRVDPNDENTIYALGVPLIKSTDGGRTFQALRDRGLHGDHHALWIDPDDPNHLVNGNDGGINLSYDGGQTWRNIENLPVVQFYNVYVDNADPFYVYGSIQDNGSWMGPVTYNPGQSDKCEWQSIPGGEASYIERDPKDKEILFSAGYYGRMRRSIQVDGRWKTTNIAPEKHFGPEAGHENEPRPRGQWLAPFMFSPSNPCVLYTGRQYLLRSMDNGESWEKISPDLTYNDPDEMGDIPYQTITTISESPLKFGLIYTGTDDGKVQVTRDGGEEWNEIMKGLPYKRWVSRVVASAYKEARVYLTLNGKRDDDLADYIYCSEDYGENWTDISGNIPGGPVNVIREDTKNPDILYVGTDLGVYVTVNRGKEWHALGKGLPIAFVHDLVIHKRDDKLVIGTHGRGVFVVDDLKPVRDMANGS